MLERRGRQLCSLRLNYVELRMLYHGRREEAGVIDEREMMSEAEEGRSKKAEGRGTRDGH